MPCPVSERPHYVVFDWCEPMHNTITGEEVRPGFYSASHMSADLGAAERWASDPMHSVIHECSRSEGVALYQARQRLSLADIERLASPYPSLAAE